MIVALLVAGLFGAAISGAFAFLGYVAWDEFGATWFGVMSWVLAALLAVGWTVTLAIAAT